VHALLGLRREDDARAAIDAWCEGLPAEVQGARRRPLAYRIAWAMRRFDEALALATSLSADAGELDDDGKLSRWEKARFECLVALGRRDEALGFGRAQCGRARDFGELAYAALGQRDRELARVLATECHGLEPDDAFGLTVLARVAELDGEVDRAIALWQRMKQVSTWHVHDENLGRIALGRGELDGARESIEAAVATGHTCPIALQLRAELRLRMGDRDGAQADAERAWACLALEQRDVSDDLAGLLAGLQGRADAATAAFDAWGRGEQSAGDRERIAALGRSLAG
jgi:tetratricopeptide (TPR) repeat protein